MSIAIGLALPNGNDAEAQGISVLAGYHYTRMICQEWGQQPRWYNVRDPIAGSDWRNDGGWAIVLIRSANIAPAGYETYGTPNYPSYGTGTQQVVLNYANLQIAPPHQTTVDPDNPVGSRITFSDGTSGFVTNFGRRVITDRNNNGVLDTGDLVYTSPSWKYVERRYRQTSAPQNYGGSYIRWANMRYCR